MNRFLTDEEYLTLDEAALQELEHRRKHEGLVLEDIGRVLQSVEGARVMGHILARLGFGCAVEGVAAQALYNAALDLMELCAKANPNAAANILKSIYKIDFGSA